MFLIEHSNRIFKTLSQQSILVVLETSTFYCQSIGENRDVQCEINDGRIDFVNN